MRRQHDILIGFRYMRPVLFYLVSVAAALLLARPAVAESIRVGLLSPSPSGTDLFWEEVIRSSQLVADDLGIELIVRRGKDNTYTTKKQGNTLLSMPRIDYFLTSYWREVTDDHMQLAKDNDIKVVLFNSIVPERIRKKIGEPRQHFLNWLLHIAPDDAAAASILTTLLFEGAQRKLSAGSDKLHIFGLNGNDDTPVDALRVAGLSQAASYHKLDIVDVTQTQWSREVAYSSTLLALTKNTNISLIWAINDNLAIGAIKAAKELDRKPGEDLLIGGFDWSEEGFKAVQAGDLYATMGGPVYEAVWALIMIYDYHHGIDFVDDIGTKMTSPYSAVTAENISRYRVISDRQAWQDMDFRRFSKKHNPKEKKYNFSFDHLVEQLQAAKERRSIAK